MDSQSVCQGCLSSDRILYSVEEHHDLYQIIVDNYLFNTKSVLLCWECTTVLKKMKLFKEQVSHATNLLMLKRRKILNVKKPKCLSKLSISHSKDTMNMKHEIKLEIDDIDTKLVEDFDNIDSNNINDFNNDIDFAYEEDNIDIDAHTAIEQSNIIASNVDDIDNNQALNIDTVNNQLNTNEIKLEDDKADIDTGLEFDNLDDQLLIHIKIKKEHERELKKKVIQKLNSLKIPRKNKYCFVKDTNKLGFEYKIDYSEIEKYMEIERSNKYYQNAKFKCELCLFNSNSEKLLKEHTSKTHDMSLPHSCIYCQSYYKTDLELQEHMQGHLVCYRCQCCSFESYTRSSMNEHTSKHVGQVKCKLCGHYDKNVRVFYDHFKEYHKRFICDYCGARRRMRQYMIEHIERQHIERKVVCTICKKSFRKKAYLTRHMLSNHDFSRTADAYCVTCDKQFDNVIKYKDHYNGVHDRAGRKFPCKVCGREFTKNIYMVRHHQKVHEKMTDFYCQTCDKYYTSAFSLRQHIQHVHEGKKLPKVHLCNMCGRGFSTTVTLHKHIRTHTGERPYKCTICGAAFTQDSPLAIHMKKQHLYEGKSPYVTRKGKVYLVDDLN